VERSGARGGSASATVTCGPGAGVVCRRDFSATGPGGRTASGSTLTRHGPFRSIRRGTVTGPRGATAAGVRAVPRWRRRW
jgi:hypothetical protein